MQCKSKGKYILLSLFAPNITHHRGIDNLSKIKQFLLLKFGATCSRFLQFCNFLTLILVHVSQQSVMLVALNFSGFCMPMTQKFAFSSLNYLVCLCTVFTIVHPSRHAPPFSISSMKYPPYFH